MKTQNGINPIAKLGNTRMVSPESLNRLNELSYPETPDAAREAAITGEALKNLGEALLAQARQCMMQHLSPDQPVTKVWDVTFRLRPATTHNRVDTEVVKRLFPPETNPGFYKQAPYPATVAVSIGSTQEAQPNAGNNSRNRYQEQYRHWKRR